MPGNVMYMRDNHVYTTWGEREDGLVISRHDLSSEINYINEHRIEYLDITSSDPRIYADHAYREYLLQNPIASKDDAQTASHFTDIAHLRNCPQLKQLSLCGDLINSTMLSELPHLHCLSLDNTFGKHTVDLSSLYLRTLYIQKPKRNICGFEKLTTLVKLCIWNYQPKSRDLSELSALSNLQQLHLIQPRIDSLAGIEALVSLRKLGIYKARTLKDSSALTRCTQPLEFTDDPNSPID